MSFNYPFNLMALIGVDINGFDPTIKSLVVSLAGLRGEAAHRNLIAAQTSPALGDLAIWTTGLIAGYRMLDDQITQLRRISA
ncbi:hypothetical protein LB554_18080 [Mesorhizobium sp. CO1-1-11]|nr:hypothetical protein [Mesorhizobium sp. CO1-1-11]